MKNYYKKLSYGFFYLINPKHLIKKTITYLSPETKKNENLFISLKKEFEYIELNFGESIFKKDSGINKILLLLFKLKTNYLNQNYADCKNLSYKIRKELISSNNMLSENSKSFVLFSAELIEIKALIDEWALNANKEYNIFYKEFFEMVEKSFNLKGFLLTIENKSSIEFINSTNEYLSFTVKIIEMTQIKNKGMIISTEKREEGNLLLNKLEYFEGKLKIYNQNIFNFEYNILLEKIKIHFYIQQYNEDSLKNNFKLMSEFCSLCLNNLIDDPIYSALESFRQNKNKNNSFKNYLYSFKI